MMKGQEAECLESPLTTTTITPYKYYILNNDNLCFPLEHRTLVEFVKPSIMLISLTKT